MSGNSAIERMKRMAEIENEAVRLNNSSLTYIKPSKKPAWPVETARAVIHEAIKKHGECSMGDLTLHIDQPSDKIYVAIRSMLNRRTLVEIGRNSRNFPVYNITRREQVNP